MARHAAEGITKNLWFAILQLILYQFVTPDIVNTMSTLFLRLPFSRRYPILPDGSHVKFLFSWFVVFDIVVAVLIFGEMHIWESLRILMLDAILLLTFLSYLQFNSSCKYLVLALLRFRDD